MGVRDIILPGEMKDLMNSVTEAKKPAEANLIARRKETAAMSSQANTLPVQNLARRLRRLCATLFAGGWCHAVAAVGHSCSRMSLSPAVGRMDSKYLRTVSRCPNGRGSLSSTSSICLRYST